MPSSARIRSIEGPVVDHFGKIINTDDLRSIPFRRTFCWRRTIVARIRSIEDIIADPPGKLTSMSTISDQNLPIESSADVVLSSASLRSIEDIFADEDNDYDLLIGIDTKVFSLRRRLHRWPRHCRRTILVNTIAEGHSVIIVHHW